MSAGGALQAAMTVALEQVGGLAGIFDGPPARAPYPYVAIDAGLETDWSHKSGEGREVSLAVTIWDEQPARLHELADAVERQMRELQSADGWQVVSLRLIRRRIIRDVAGPWAAAVDFRARLLAN